jgi:hypothetical protein
MSGNKLLDTINHRVDGIADKFIKFRTCFALYLAGIASSVLSLLALYAFKLISLDRFNKYIEHPGVLLIGAAVFLYIYLGYIKYANLIQNHKLRKAIIVIIVLWAADVVLSNIGYPMDWLIKQVPFAGIISPLLLFLIFRTLKNDEVIYFQRLAKLNFYIFIVQLVILVQKLASVKYVILLSYFIMAFIGLITFFREATLFRHLYRKFEKAKEATV